MTDKNLQYSKKKRFSVDDHFFTIHEYSLDYENSEIYLMGSESYATELDEPLIEPGVDYTMANKFIKNLQTLMKKGPDEAILIHMKTCGGDWSEGMAIYDAIKNCPNPVTILNYSHARSMSSLIFLAGSKRIMMPHSTYMFHRGSQGMGGTVTQFLTEAEECKKALISMKNVYIEAMRKDGKMKKWSDKRIDTWLDDKMNKKEEVYFDAMQSVEFGFAHEVFDGNWDKLRVYTTEQLSY